MYSVMALTSKSAVSGGKPFVRMSVLVPMTGHRRGILLLQQSLGCLVGAVILRTSVNLISLVVVAVLKE
jgi:hypothetical protein